MNNQTTNVAIPSPLHRALRERSRATNRGVGAEATIAIDSHLALPEPVDPEVAVVKRGTDTVAVEFSTIALTGWLRASSQSGASINETIDLFGRAFDAATPSGITEGVKLLWEALGMTSDREAAIDLIVKSWEDCPASEMSPRALERIATEGMNSLARACLQEMLERRSRKGDEAVAAVIESKNREIAAAMLGDDVLDDPETRLPVRRFMLDEHPAGLYLVNHGKANRLAEFNGLNWTRHGSDFCIGSDPGGDTFGPLPGFPIKEV